VACQDNYVGKNPSAGGRSGLYVSDLPGVEELQYNLLSKDSETTIEVWERISRNAWNGLVSDIETYLQSKFFVNSKLLSRETSEFLTDVNASANLAGIRIQYDLSKYSRIHIISIEVYAEQAYASPEVVFQFLENNEDGAVLHEVSTMLTEGLNSIPVDFDFDVESIFVAYDPQVVELRQSKNKNYDWYPKWHPEECVFPCFGGYGSVKQINDGGVNVIYDVYCSSEKFVCQNLNLFRKPFQWRYGVELANERRIGNRLNQFTTMTQERKEELFTFYNTEYQQALENSLRAQNIYEDWVCFECKGVVGVRTSLP
jgi:hypothetical protein